MNKKVRALDTGIYEYGEAVEISENGSVKLPLSFKKTQQVLFIKTANDYKLIPMVADIKKLYIEVTTQCNFACITCIRSSWEEEYAHMEWETFERILESIDELPDLKTVFFGGFGEPLKHPRIVEMIKKVKDRGLRAEMITNGSYLNEEIINQLIDLKLDGIFVSLDSSEAENYNKIRPGGDFSSVYHNLENLQRIKQNKKTEKPELGIEIVAMKKNFLDLPNLTQLAFLNLRASQVIITNLLPYHESMKDEIVYDTNDTGAFLKCEAIKLFYHARLPALKLRTERCCKFIQEKTMSINFRGDVSPCYALMHSYKCYIYGREKHIYPCYLGNVNEKSIKEIWMKRGYINFRQAVAEYRFPSCTDCKYLNGCGYTGDNVVDCWANSPSCAECLWSRQIIACP